jgi:L,D-transpeptidase catalytic domain/Bacterial Ig-like domain
VLAVLLSGPPARAAVAAPGSPPALRVMSVSPAPGARGVDGTDPVTVDFSAALATGSPVPSLHPSVPGSWSQSGAMLVFTPSVPFTPGQAVTLRIPGGQSGVRAADGGVLARHLDVRFRTQGWSTLRLQQILAQLRYLPLSWRPQPVPLPAAIIRPPATAPAGGAAASLASQLTAVYNPPAGAFRWRHAGYPASLTSLWRPGHRGLVLTGALMAFEADHHLPLNHTAGPGVWRVLLRALARGQTNPHGYSYAVADKSSPETLTVWHNGAVVLRSPANTGIAVSPTVDGTFPVYLRFQFTIMSGFNPDGSHYSDPVWWVSYFNGGDAVHYYPRASYGWPQSLGCVELPWTQAKQAWPYLTYGSLVTVVG